jgi:hypothetical protein
MLSFSISYWDLIYKVTCCVRASVRDHWTQRKVTVDGRRGKWREKEKWRWTQRKVKTYLLTYNLASLSGPKAPGPEKPPRWRAFEVLKPRSWEQNTEGLKPRCWDPGPETSHWGPETQVLKPRVEVLKPRSWEPNIEVLKPRSWQRACVINWLKQLTGTH